MALAPVDRLLSGYLVFVTGVIILRWEWNLETAALLGMHVLFALLMFAFSRLDRRHRLGNFLHDVYPLLLLFPLYSEIGVLGDQLGRAVVFDNDATVQNWEAALFGAQVSYTWIREYPSVFWSGLLHLGYLSYYPIITLGPGSLMLKGDWKDARRVIFTMMTAFVVCYTIFILFPVGGPNYAFDWPTGPVREVWSAQVVYRLLEGGSAFGTAFPSSHVAATTAVVLGLWSTRRNLAYWFLLPAILLIVGTVYCQMHYAVDALVGLVIGVAAAGGVSLARSRISSSPPALAPEG